MAKYKRTFTSGQKKLSKAGEEIDFKLDVYPRNDCNVEFFHFQTFAQECHIKINDEQTLHWIDSNSELILSDIKIDRFTIIEGNVEYYYTAMTTE